MGTASSTDPSPRPARRVRSAVTAAVAALLAVAGLAGPAAAPAAAVDAASVLVVTTPVAFADADGNFVLLVALATSNVRTQENSYTSVSYSLDSYYWDSDFPVPPLSARDTVEVVNGVGHIGVGGSVDFSPSEPLRVVAWAEVDGPLNQFGRLDANEVPGFAHVEPSRV